jgi:hypothetical protein
MIILLIGFQLFILKSTPSVFLQKKELPDTFKVSDTARSATEKIDISGHWSGTITRDEGSGRRTVFRMELDLRQKGKDIEGISYVFYDGEKRTYSANMELSGKFKGSYFKYLETKMLQYDPIPENEWCIKKVELIYKLAPNSAPTLEGIWEGATGSSRNCIPGRVFLQKKPPRV